ncbi:MAG: hypothetical protein JWM16_5198, partial [Verrucomicrobiales bacterium]|nr:hypothetical protein [Verrucomicrobiales bacterium]
NDYSSAINEMPLSNVVQTASVGENPGVVTGLFLKQDGRVEVRNNGWYPAQPPFVLSNIVNIGLGRTAQALTRDGTLIEWGYDLPTSYLSNVVSFSANSSGGLALTASPKPQFRSFTLGRITNTANNDILLYLSPPSPSNPKYSLKIFDIFGGSAYQYSNGERGDFIYSYDELASVVADPDGRIFWALEPWANDGFTFFQYGFEVGSYGSVGTVTVLFTNAPFSEIESLKRQPDGSMLISAHGVVNGSYAIQGSSELSNWLNLGTATAGSNGTYFFRDVEAPIWPRRFYRLSSPLAVLYAT